MTIRPAKAGDRLFLTRLAVRYFGLVYPKIRPSYVAEYFRWSYRAQPALMLGTLIAEQGGERVGAVTMRTPDHHQRSIAQGGDRDAFPLRLATFAWRLQIGLSKLTGHVDALASQVGILENLGVIRAHQGLGIGAQLVDASVAAAQQANLSEVRLWVVAGSGLEKWYRRFGFHTVRSLQSARSTIFLGRSGWVEMQKSLGAAQ